MLLLAHRGDHRAAPENSIAAFRAAVDAGTDGTELDVRASGDGEAVVVHDPDLRRVQGVRSAVGELTADQLATFGVPRLADVLAALPSSFIVDVELKETVVDAAIRAIEGARGLGAPSMVLSSFDRETLELVRGRRPAWPRWLIGGEASTIERAVDLGCEAVALRWQAITPGIVARTHEAGLRLIAWTVRSAVLLRQLNTIGVDGACVEGSAMGVRRAGARSPAGSSPSRGCQAR